MHHVGRRRSTGPDGTKNRRTKSDQRADFFVRRVTCLVVSDTPSNAGTGPRESDEEMPVAEEATPAPTATEAVPTEGGPDDLTTPEPTPPIEPTHPADEPSPDAPPVKEPSAEGLPGQEPSPDAPPVAMSTDDPPPPLATPPAVPVLPPSAVPPVDTPSPSGPVTEEADDDAAPPARKKMRTWQFAALTVLAIGFLVGAFFLGQDSGDDAVPDATTTTVAGQAELVTFTDEETGFTIGYPEGWDALDFPAGDALRFAASTEPGADDGVTVRVTNVGFNIGTGPDDVSVTDAKAYTADLLADQGLTLVEQRDLLDGTPTFFYLYRFTDPTTKQEGTHAHYFVFEGGTMTQLVFQALPTANYEDLVPTFAAMVQSFTPPTSAPTPPPSSSTAPDSVPPSAPSPPAPENTTTTSQP